MSALAASFCAAEEGVLRLPPEASQWTPLPNEVREAERPRHRLVMDGPAMPKTPDQPAFAAKRTGQGVEFSVIGDTPDKRAMTWSVAVPAANLSAYPYYVFRYRARGIMRSYAPIAVLEVSGTDADGKTVTEPLMDVAQVFSDGLWHTVIGKKELKLSVNTLRATVATCDDLGQVALAGIAFHRSLPEIAMSAGLPSLRTEGAQFAPVSLAGRFNDTLAAALERVLTTEGFVTDGASAFARPRADSPAAFVFSTGGPNIIKPTENASVNQQEADFVGIKTTRAYYKPIARDDAIEIPIGRAATEVFFTLVSELPKGGPRYAVTPGPKDFADLGALAVELRYSDGETDTVFPYSLTDEGYTMQRMTGAYVVPADPSRTLQTFVLRNRVFGITHSLAALAVNTAPQRLLPALAEETAPLRAPMLPPPEERPPSVQRNGDRLVFANTWYTAAFSTAQGLSLEEFSCRWTPDAVRLSPRSGIEVIAGDTTLTGRAFRTESVTVEGLTATVVLRSLAPTVPVQLTVAITADASARLAWTVTVVNLGTQPARWTIRFAALRGLRIGSHDDTWMFFPQYRNVMTNEECFHQTPNDRPFPMQWFDVYNPRLGVGLAVLTHNRDNTTLDYALGKDRSGVTAYVQVSAEYNEFAPNSPVRLTEVCLVPHTGDWHEAFAAYRRWLAEWWRPIHAQDKEWFNRLFVLRTHLTGKYYSWAIPIYDPEKKEYLIDRFVAGDTEYLGTAPEVFHLGGWVSYDKAFQGDIMEGDYAVKDYTGGPDALRAAVRKLQEEHHIAVSLYTIPDRCGKETDVGRRLGPQIVSRRADGSAEEDARWWYLCPQSKAWQDHYVEALVRTQRETGVKILYVDVFPFSSGSRCYAKDHGHEVPTQANHASEELIRRIRAALPPDVAVWAEFPGNDIVSQYLDGIIHYYPLYWHEYFSVRRNHSGRAPQRAPVAWNAYHYAFPHLRNFVFLCGSEDWSSDSKFLFFNAEPVYDVAWFLYAGPHLDRMRKSFALQKRYADCFAGDAPEMDVPTERTSVFANRFPGNGRTAWTLYNARYTTVRGTVLAVTHRDGATYRDVWNDTPLTPKIHNGVAYIALTLDPQGLGCVVQETAR